MFSFPTLQHGRHKYFVLQGPDPQGPKFRTKVVNNRYDSLRPEKRLRGKGKRHFIEGTDVIPLTFSQKLLKVHDMLTLNAI